MKLETLTRTTLHEERIFLVISSLDCARDPELCRRATNRHESCGLAGSRLNPMEIFLIVLLIVVAGAALVYFMNSPKGHVSRSQKDGL